MLSHCQLDYESRAVSIASEIRDEFFNTIGQLQTLLASLRRYLA